LNLAETSVAKSRPSVPYGANLFIFKTVCQKWHAEIENSNEKHFEDNSNYNKNEMSQLFWVDLIKWVSHVRPCVRPSIKSLLDFSEMWNVCRGRWVMHDGMLHDPIQGQGQGHEPLKVGNHFQKLSPPPFTKVAGNWPLILKLGTMPKFDRAVFLIFVLVFCVTWLWTWQKRNVSCEESTVSPARG